jgi:hypothetical protein
MVLKREGGNLTSSTRRAMILTLGSRFRNSSPKFTFGSISTVELARFAKWDVSNPSPGPTSRNDPTSHFDVILEINLISRDFSFVRGVNSSWNSL